MDHKSIIKSLQILPVYQIYVFLWTLCTWEPSSCNTLPSSSLSKNPVYFMCLLHWNANHFLHFWTLSSLGHSWSPANNVPKVIDRNIQTTQSSSVLTVTLSVSESVMPLLILVSERGFLDTGGWPSTGCFSMMRPFMSSSSWTVLTEDPVVWPTVFFVFSGPLSDKKSTWAL